MEYSWRGPATLWKTAAPVWRTYQYGYTYREPRSTRCDNRDIFSRFYQQPRINRVPQCFTCRMYGHIARNCGAQGRGLPNKEPKRKPTRKSGRKINRDRRRYVQFKDRKSICAMMPFWNISDRELLAFMPKWSVTHPVPTTSKVSVAEYALICAVSEVSTLKLENTNLTAQNKSMSINVTSMENDIREKEVKILELTKKNKALEKEQYELKFEVGKLKFILDAREKNKKKEQKEAETREHLRLNKEKFTHVHERNKLEAVY